jgi:plasmid stability protein
MIQIRNVPDYVHRKLKARAAQAGMSLSDYLINQIKELSERPTLDEMRARLGSRPPAPLDEDAAQIIRAERDKR